MTAPPPFPSYRQQMDAAERQVILRALTLTGGRRDRAARLLQLSLRNFFYKLRKYGIRRGGR